MTDWLYLSDEQRLATLSEAYGRSGISAKAIEKDWWVTLVLKALFEGPFGEYLVFKGGTSLSKGCGMIQRFSEDVDIALDPQAFDMQYKETPSKSYVSELKKAGCSFTSIELKTHLEQMIDLIGAPAGSFEVRAAEVKEDHTDKDPQVLYVSYRSLLDPNPYLKDEVKIEVGVRSLLEPHVPRPIVSILTEYFPSLAYPEEPFTAPVVDPRKTFLEKVFLLTEEFAKPGEGRAIRVERMSRHLSDLASMDKQGVGDQALADPALYEAIVTHRQYYSMHKWFDYAKLAKSSVNFIPPDDLLQAYAKDYDTMLEHMIYDADAPTFESILATLRDLEMRFRN